MTGIYIGSTVPRSGKSLLSFSLGTLLQQAGCSVGYMKPLGSIPQKKDELVGDADALVVQEVLGQNAPANVLSPAMIPKNMHSLVVQAQHTNDDAIARIHAAYQSISAGKDVTLVSGSGSFPATGRFCNADGLRVLRALGLKILFVERFTDRLHYDALLFLKDLLGDDMLGVIFNDVPDSEMRDVVSLLKPYIEEQGIEVLGVLGREPGLSAMRVAELAEGLEGRIVAGNAFASRIANGFLIGTMQVDSFMLHLRQRPGCAVIAGGDRADLQLAALYASSPCIILTGNIAPSEMIRSRAESMGVTLISVREQTYSVARAMTRILRAKKIRDLSQIQLAVDLVKNALDIPCILDRIKKKSLTVSKESGSREEVVGPADILSATCKPGC